jgi:hypothetical protein
MSTNTNANITNTSAEQNRIDSIFVKHLGARVSLKATVMVHHYGEREIKFLDFTDMSNDAHVLALPALGLKGEDRVRLVSKGDSAKAKFRRDNLSVGKIKSAVNEASRGMKWEEFVELVATMEKYTYAKGEDGKRVKTGTELRYKTVHSTDAELHFMQKYVFKDVQCYLKSLAYSEKRAMSPEDKARARAEAAIKRAEEMLARAKADASKLTA